MGKIQKIIRGGTFAAAFGAAAIALSGCDDYTGAIFEDVPSSTWQAAAEHELSINNYSNLQFYAATRDVNWFNDARQRDKDPSIPFLTNHFRYAAQTPDSASRLIELKCVEPQSSVKTNGHAIVKCTIESVIPIAVSQSSTRL